MAGQTPTPRVAYTASARQPQQAAADEPRRPQVEQLVTKAGKTRKPPLRERFAENLIAESAGGVGNYIVMDVLLPAFKTMVADAFSQGVERMLFGDSRPRASGLAAQRPGYTAYQRMPMRAQVTPQAPLRQAQVAEPLKHETIVMATRGDAEVVIQGMMDRIDQYGLASVADLLQMSGAGVGSFTDDKYGWTSVAGAGFTRGRDGYLLHFPTPQPID